jgi:hypothetical protein
VVAVGQALDDQRGRESHRLGLSSIDYETVAIGVELNPRGRGSDAERWKDYVRATSATTAKPGEWGGPQEKGAGAGTAG